MRKRSSEPIPNMGSLGQAVQMPGRVDSDPNCGPTGRGLAGVNLYSTRRSGTAFQLASPLAVAGILALAVLLRFYLLADVPRFTDESDDMLVTYALSTGQEVPLVNYSSYVGVLLTYLVAPVFALFGPRLEYARLVVALCGVLALVPTYLLARRLGGHWAGLAAAALLAASAPHALLSSRVAWSHSLSPLFVTLAAWLLIRAVELRGGRSLVLAGLAAGLSLQTHPTVAALLPGALLYLLLRGRALLLSRWSLLAAAAALAANANLLYYNLATNGESVTRGQQVLGDYSILDRSPSFRGTVLEMLVSGVRLIGANITDPFMTPYPPVFTPASVLLVSLVVLSLALCAVRGQPLPLLLAISGLTLLPALLGRYEPLMTEGRYLMPVLPACLAAAGAGAVRLACWRLPLKIGPALAAGCLALAVSVHSWTVFSYLSDSVERGLTNERYRQAESILIDAAQVEDVLLDSDLYDEGTGGGGKLSKLFRYSLKVHGIPYRIMAEPASLSIPSGEKRIVVLRTSSLATFASGQITALLPAAKAPPGGRFGIYLVQYPARRGTTASPAFSVIRKLAKDQ